jgi:hypothetical protein
MSKADDCSVPPEMHTEIRKHATRLLRQAGACDQFPTPVEQIIAAAELSVAAASLDEGFLKKAYGAVTGTIKKALGKVLGLFDSQDKKIYLDLSVKEQKRRFVSLHETGHGFLPWQRDAYALVEDGEVELDPEVKQEFERQAGVFASEVLFQIDRFEKDAKVLPFAIKTPMDLAKRYGSSVYAAMRRFVSTSHRCCAVLIFDEPVHEVGRGNRFELRRVVASQRFLDRFGIVKWPDAFYGRDPLGNRLPQFNRKLTKRCRIESPITEISEALYLEAFDSTYQVFALIFPESELKSIMVSI